MQGDGGAQARVDPGKADVMYVCFAILSCWCVRKSRGPIW